MVKKTFKDVVHNIVKQPNGEHRLIVERTTEVYGNPVNSLTISKDTVLIGRKDKKLTINDFQRGQTVTVSLKDAFTEETPYYYPTVYEVKITN